MFGIGTTELIIVLIIALLIFGHKLPSVARGLGSSVKEFKKGVNEGEADPAPSTQVPPPSPPVEKK